MIQKVLIANRGEVAVRIIRACRELNIRTVAVYATVDKDALHVMLADEAICIGDHQLSNSYMSINAILQAAINSGCQAIHPGYGFLSENVGFVRACEQIGITFIGPSSTVIELMGDKQSARDSMIAAGVPVVPGSVGLVKSVQEAFEISESLGYPVIIKATAGGGGKGMRICYSSDLLEESYINASSEGASVFGNGDVYIEKYIENPRHIEVQVIGDMLGNVAHLFERECSVQRNNQKMIEEAPVVNIKESTKQRLYDVALRATASIGYTSVGTLEFIMDSNESFYFIEMNTRLQVEHPVTESIVGIDLVKEQINIAQGNALSFKQTDLKIRGHAIEIRINAEDPYNGFKPNAGLITALHFPGGNGVRIDSFIYQGYRVLPFYDSMIAKIILHANDRDTAIEKAIYSLEELDVVGINTNVEFQLEVLLSQKFLDNEYDTSLVKSLLEG